MSTPAGARPRVVNPWFVAVAVMSATFMEVLDTTVVNVSLPHIAGDLSATIDESTWALTSYLVANAI
ncbi:MAG TPA: EmrB/QacA family drug resistance transporter, partial [Vicinamibacteria bacterium]|nr:EmrB/QacA family drug resistance transporter [Vicinamibacteria bacterium]